MIVYGVLDHGAMSAIRIRESGTAISDRLEVILTASACGQGVGYNNALELSRLAVIRLTLAKDAGSICGQYLIVPG